MYEDSAKLTLFCGLLKVSLHQHNTAISQLITLILNASNVFICLFERTNHKLTFDAAKRKTHQPLGLIGKRKSNAGR